MWKYAVGAVLAGLVLGYQLLRRRSGPVAGEGYREEYVHLPGMQVVAMIAHGDRLVMEHRLGTEHRQPAGRR